MPPYLYRTIALGDTDLLKYHNFFGFAIFHFKFITLIQLLILIEKARKIYISVGTLIQNGYANSVVVEKLVGY